MKDLSAEDLVIIAAKAIANSQAFPRTHGMGKGMNYEQWLIGQALDGLLANATISELLEGKRLGVYAIRIAGDTIIELAKQQIENEDGE